MADRRRNREELVFCHSCRSEWRRDQHGLECPDCGSDFVEMIEEGHDPRNDVVAAEATEEGSDRLPHNLLHHPDPWDREAPDPDEGGIQHVEWNAGPGLRFSRTSYRSSTPGRGAAGSRIEESLVPFIQSVSTMIEGTAAPQRQPAFIVGSGSLSGPRHGRINEGPNIHFPSAFEHSPWNATGPGSAPGTPFREMPPFAGRHTQTSTTRVWPRDANNGPPATAQVDNLQGILGSLIQSINSLNNNGSPERNDPNTTVSPLHSLFAQLFNPANAAHGDAVYTEEALDRVISQIMEQANGASAPGPASAEAISRLPQKAADKSMMGSDGKAECSVCMDSVSLGDTVTVLPCRHWFHGECVGAWLREHDTCPHCRQGIMPKDPGDASDPAARPPGLPPRNSQPPSPAATPSGTGPGRAVQFTWQSGGPGTFSTVDPRSRPHDYTRHQPGSREGRNGGEGSSGGGSSGGGGGGLSGWVRDRWGRGNSDRT